MAVCSFGASSPFCVFQSTSRLAKLSLMQKLLLSQIRFLTHPLVLCFVISLSLSEPFAVINWLLVRVWFESKHCIEFTGRYCALESHDGFPILCWLLIGEPSVR
jgi:hypothetical protein